MSKPILDTDKNLPKLAELIEQNASKDIPPEAAWIWGDDDEIGRINLLSPERVKLATKEIVSGKTVPLNWDMTKPAVPSFGRQPLELSLHKHPIYPVYDDHFNMNPQSGSQFDGFRHFAYVSRQIFYNNLKLEEVETTSRCGIQAIAQHGIAGRGVLLDFVAYAKDNSIDYDPMSAFEITLNHIKGMIARQKLELHYGDILLVNAGWIEKYETLYKQDPSLVVGVEMPSAIGLQPSDELRDFLHDTYVSVVGADTPSFERSPLDPSQHLLHEYLLTCWGVLIGEMLDTRALAEECKKTGKYSFFFTSAPFNSPGGVSTLANAMAIL
ncbi:hypothetical protein CANCADRAFT_1108 [Tortispora caseinolytica NRRL Y-17796]|uniref:Cyclase n=1 Tax=Tortispora caseinolytica NRRL Y-17796 TaxID=767744 RepID=A0A1E4TL85_9ASCO|nr:hypothetical protein CANCADRAFT_1108 [Tortispora caseinolytica NRRL Y-17796]